MIQVVLLCVVRVWLRFQIFSFFLNYLNCCPHVPVCLNLVYNKAEEMCEMTEACLSFLCFFLVREHFKTIYFKI